MREEEFWRRDGVLYGSFNYEGHRLVGLYERGVMDLETFFDYYERLACPHLDDAEGLAKILVSGLFLVSKAEAEILNELLG